MQSKALILLYISISIHCIVTLHAFSLIVNGQIYFVTYVLIKSRCIVLFSIALKHTPRYIDGNGIEQNHERLNDLNLLVERCSNDVNDRLFT